MCSITTTDFSKFGHRERKLAIALLTAWNEQGLPEDFGDNEVVMMFNSHSGAVFLTNSDCLVAMMNGDKLEIFYTDFETGEEGFINELSEEALQNLGLKPVLQTPKKSTSLIDGSEFGYDDRRRLEYFLTAWNEDSLPENFSREGIKIISQDGNIILTNAQNQTTYLDGYDVKLCRIDPETGEEIFDD